MRHRSLTPYRVKCLPQEVRPARGLLFSRCSRWETISANAPQAVSGNAPRCAEGHRARSDALGHVSEILDLAGKDGLHALCGAIVQPGPVEPVQAARFVGPDIPLCPDATDGHLGQAQLLGHLRKLLRQGLITQDAINLWPVLSHIEIVIREESQSFAPGEVQKILFIRSGAIMPMPRNPEKER